MGSCLQCGAEAVAYCRRCRSTLCAAHDRDELPCAMCEQDYAAAVAGGRAPRYAVAAGLGLGATVVVAVSVAVVFGPTAAVIAKLCGVALTPVAVHVFDRRWLRRHRRKFERQALDPLPTVHLLRS